ncbi:hypothetical protein [Cupriavidus sp. YAF13]|uniref:hypothetical protein n=1 Tax=Cupriavidus sp. YAF13 TaxID=3233075 RepID=UPI003F928965
MAEIYAALVAGRFTLADFDVSVGTGGTNLLRITFLPQKAFELAVDDGSRLLLRMSPGAHKETDLVALDSLAGVPKHITGWTRNIYAELRASLPVMGEIEELQKRLEAHLKSHVENPAEPFTVDEAAAMQQKLDAVIEDLARFRQRDEITQKQLDELVQEVERLKDELSYFPKGTWYRSAGSKLWTLLRGVATSKEGRELASDIARKAIGMD